MAQRGAQLGGVGARRPEPVGQRRASALGAQLGRDLGQVRGQVLQQVVAHLLGQIGQGGTDLRRVLCDVALFAHAGSRSSVFMVDANSPQISAPCLSWVRPAALRA
ncbi:hypothetical protein CS0771_05460 [Catellatospora sp. IY07-71]|nr:hypothetical protein CS0771_05460 [Catellatospora sp. IY07-71]